MNENFRDASIGEITKLLQDYFDGLYDVDLEKFCHVCNENSHHNGRAGADGLVAGRVF